MLVHAVTFVCVWGKANLKQRRDRYILTGDCVNLLVTPYLPWGFILPLYVRDKLCPNSSTVKQVDSISFLSLHKQYVVCVKTGQVLSYDML